MIAKYECPDCGYIYDEAKESVAFSDLPSTWVCPDCGASKSSFSRVENFRPIISSDDMYEILIKDHKLITEIAKRDENGYDISKTYIKKCEVLDYVPLYYPGTGIIINNDDILERTISVDTAVMATRAWVEAYVEEHGGKINVIKRNGIALPIVDKVVDITVADKTSELENDGDGTSPFATVNEITINKIYLGDEEITPVDKVVTFTYDKLRTFLNITNIDNTSDLNKPISIAMQSALDNKITIEGSTPYLKSVSASGTTLTITDQAGTVTTFIGSDITGTKITIGENEVYKIIKNGKPIEVDYALMDGVGNNINDWYASKTSVNNITALIPDDASTENKLATEDYVDTYGGKIDKIYVNGIEQAIVPEDKSVRITDVASNAVLVAHIANTNNPHSVTKSQVGLGNVDNTSDVDKPVSTAQKAYIDAETTRATEAEGTLQTNIDNEATTRAETDTILTQRIDSLSQRGRYLTLWYADTHEVKTTPTTTETTYTYKTGDYYIVGRVSSTGTNYKPYGSSITKVEGQWVIGYTTETEKVTVNSTYLYDGSTWVLLSGGVAPDYPVKDVYFKNSTVVDENDIAQLPSTLDSFTDDSTHRLVTDTEKSTWSGKQDTLTAGDNITITNNVVSAVDTKYTVTIDI